MVGALHGEIDHWTAEFATASLAMDEINAQEAAEAAAEAYEQLMEARAGKEVERAAQVEAVEIEIAEF